MIATIIIIIYNIAVISTAVIIVIGTFFSLLPTLTKTS